MFAPRLAATAMDRCSTSATSTAPPPKTGSTDAVRHAVTVCGPLLTGAADDFGFGPSTESGDPWLGCEVGGARLLRLVGAGGMGRVYEAEQRSPSRRVAVKLTRPESLPLATARRLGREADVLATLEHPAIARVHAAGTQPLADGRTISFMVMEFVPDARPITEWCRVHELDPRARLETLLLVCDAVGHAHARGVVHRDLKPGNVLVDAAGRPRLVDFGIAAWVAPTAPTLSVAGRITGTPAYMSPEQREGSATDTRTDVYALGVLAAELLTDESPARAQVTLAGRHDRLARIVRRCLEIDAADRYGSVREFAEALRAELDRDRHPGAWRRPAVRLTVWTAVLMGELFLIGSILLGDRFAPPVSRPVFGPDQAAPIAPARPFAP